MRYVIIGNSGSGKSTLSASIGLVTGLPVHDLDLTHWHLDRSKRDAEDAKDCVRVIAKGEKWVIEGVYGWLAEVALTRAEMLIWLDVPWEECRTGLLARGLRRGMVAEDQQALLTWAEDYWNRSTSSSFAGHELLYQAFSGNKRHIRSRAEIDDFLSTPARQRSRLTNLQLP